MSKTRAPRRSRDERLQLIDECRKSGLTDAEWCRQHDICVSTFYTWLKRFRREACEIPKPLYGHSLTPSEKQDIVRVDIKPDDPVPALLPAQEKTAGLHFDNSHTVEIMISDITIHATNDADPMLLAQMLCALKGGFVC